MPSSHFLGQWIQHWRREGREKANERSLGWSIQALPL